MVWMDTDVKAELPGIIDIAAKSPYSIDELELIYWEEVRPAVWTNMLMIVGGEWAGYELNWLADRIVDRSSKSTWRFPRWLCFYSSHYWSILKTGVLRLREIET